MERIITIILICILGTAFTLTAQVKYEYGSVTYITRLGSANLQVTTADGTRRFEMSASEDAARAIVTKVSDMAKIGWETYNTSEYNGNADLYSLTYFIRRKKENTATTENVVKQEVSKPVTEKANSKELKVQYLAENSPATETEYGELVFRNDCIGCSDAASLNLVMNKLYNMVKQLKRIKVVSEDLSSKYPSVYTTIIIKNFSSLVSRNIDGQFSSATVKLSMQFSQRNANGTVTNMPLNIEELSISALHDNNTALMNWFQSRLDVRLNSFLKSFIAVKGTVISAGETAKNGDIKSILVRNDNNLDDKLKYFGTIYEKGDIQRVGNDLKIGTKLGVGVLKKTDGGNLEFKITDGADKIKQKLDGGKALEILLDFKD